MSELFNLPLRDSLEKLDRHIYDADGEPVAMIHGDTVQQEIKRRAHIVRCVNSFDQVLLALALMTEAAEKDIAIFGGQPKKESALGLARAALAAAKGAGDANT